MATVLIVCGGTGGHLTPGIAIAEVLSLRGYNCVLVVSRKQVDTRLANNYPHLKFVDAPGAPLSWHPLRLIKFIFVQFAAFVFALRLLSRHKPDLILGFGGFLSAGVALPGCLKGIPFALHEANRVVGRSNRLLSRFANRIFLPPGVDLPGLKAERLYPAGLPLRKEFKPLPMDEARNQLGIQPAKKFLVVFGGSQGASSLNRWAWDHGQELAERGVSLYCLTGLRSDYPEEVNYTTSSGVSVTSWFVPFSDSMPAVLSSADAVVSRAGAGSIGEIIRCRVPAILIPYPYARDDHQTANARYVSEKGAAVVLDEAQLSCLMDEVCRLLQDSETASSLRSSLESLDNPHEAEQLADALEALMPAHMEKSPATSVHSTKV